MISFETTAGPLHIDADRLAPKLYIGSWPKPWEGSDLLRLMGFDTIVLCAQEYQPPAHRFPGLKVIHAPFDDRPLLSLSDTHIVQTTARQVYGELQRGRRVLVTCQAGRNRSGLVCARVLMKMSGAPAHLVVDHVQRLRRDALTNEVFVRSLGDYAASQAVL